MSDAMPSGKEVMQQKIVTVQAHWAAPLPPPEMMRQYNDIIPNAADRILPMAENEAASRHSNEDAARKDGVAYRAEVMRGQIFTLAIIILGISSSVVCAYIGQPWVAGVLGGTTLISVVNAMLNAKGKTRD